MSPTSLATLKNKNVMFFKTIPSPKTFFVNLTLELAGNEPKKKNPKKFE
jgi:hypothetical protein